MTPIVMIRKVDKLELNGGRMSFELSSVEGHEGRIKMTLASHTFFEDKSQLLFNKIEPTTQRLFQFTLKECEDQEGENHMLDRTVKTQEVAYIREDWGKGYDDKSRHETRFIGMTLLEGLNIEGTLMKRSYEYDPLPDPELKPWTHYELTIEQMGSTESEKILNEFVDYVNELSGTSEIAGSFLSKYLIKFKKTKEEF